MYNICVYMICLTRSTVTIHVRHKLFELTRNIDIKRLYEMIPRMSEAMLNSDSKGKHIDIWKIF